MPLEHGLYKIYYGPDGSREVGRYPIEDLSLLPKQVYALDDGVRSAAPWVVEKNSDGNSNTLRALGAKTGTDGRGGYIVALLIEEMGTVGHWVLTERPQHGSHVFTIEDSSSGNAWVGVEEDGRTRIHVKPLQDSNNPSHESLFRFVRVDQE
ncbi:hypothetical protein TWF281_010480 [Arthrobotrys megalospora]